MENQAPQSWHSGCHGSSCLGSCFLTSASKEVWKAAWPPGVSQINHAFSQGPHPLRKTNRIMPSWGLFVPSTSPAPAQGASGKKEHQSYSPAWLHQETETSYTGGSQIWREDRWALTVHFSGTHKAGFCHCYILGQAQQPSPGRLFPYSPHWGRT